MSSHPVPTSHEVEVEGLRLHYLAAGQGPPVLLLHGWPTSSFLWRNVMGPIAGTNRVLALDLPGFGRSDKPLDASYSFRFFRRILDGFLDRLELTTTSLAVHDLGGPVGLYWACTRSPRLDRLALLNTFFYSKPSWAVILFVLALRTPAVRAFLTSPAGLRFALRFGVADRSRLTAEALEGVVAPFPTRRDRQALIRAGLGLSPKGFVTIEKRFPELEVPVRVVYGARDRILPDISDTVARVQREHPGAEVTVLEDCAHFIQEERPEEIGRLLGAFFDPAR